MTKWYTFDPKKGYRQRRPPDHKWVLVKTHSKSHGLPDPISVGYIKYAAGDRSCPYFVCPGVGGVAMAWCDCLPDDYIDTRPETSFTDYPVAEQTNEYWRYVNGVSVRIN